MILQALVKYYDRLANTGQDIAPEGLEKREIPFLIILGNDGSFVDLEDTRVGDGKKKAGRVFLVPKAVKRSSGIAANLFWDNQSYIFGITEMTGEQADAKQVKRAKMQHEDFVKRLRETFPDAKDVGVRAVMDFLQTGDFSSVYAHPLWPEVVKSQGNLTFKVAKDTALVCQRPQVINILTIRPNEETRTESTCLVTGKNSLPVRLHSAIKGVWGAQPSGGNIVSFNLPAFNSYGKTQGFNASIGSKAEFAYTTALNTLLSKGSKQRIQVGNASTVFWAAELNPMENMFADFFGEPTNKDSAQDNESIRALFAAPQAGVRPLNQDLTPFYVLGLSPNASRIAVRFWYPSTVAEVAEHIAQHFNDCRIEHGPGQPEYLSLFRLLVSTAPLGDAKNIPPMLAGEVMKAILKGTPYPRSLLTAALSRIRAEQAGKDGSSGKRLTNVTYPRVSLIKAILVRDARYYNKEKEVGVTLDTSNMNTGYRLGRLFAVLEQAQERASGGNLNATIRDRFYGSASSTPVVAFPLLLKLKNHHISKIESKGSAVKLEKLIGEIMDGLADFPPHLSLADQGHFAIGYYHQRQSFFTKTPQAPFATNEQES